MNGYNILTQGTTYYLSTVYEHIFSMLLITEN
ncbi:hypothetical protein BSF42_31680 [Flavobacterium sp. ACN6]|nr:hypothetical protein BSF42_31680 [Flavobacterium sp. ACN6]